MKKTLNIALLCSFIVTILAPLTGIVIHKLASAVFLLLCIVHTVCYRKQLGGRRFLLLVLVAACFATGLFGMILRELPVIMQLHRIVSIGAVFFLAIHIFVFRKRLR